MTSDSRRSGVKAQMSRPETFRQAIEKAEADGAARGDLVLRLTTRDAADLKRDRNIAVEDISFTGGVMRFLGVKVVAGGVPASILEPENQG